MVEITRTYLRRRWGQMFEAGNPTVAKPTIITDRRLEKSSTSNNICNGVHHMHEMITTGHGFFVMAPE